MSTTHRLILGDSLKVLKNIQNNSIDLIFADPPYNISQKKGLEWKYSTHITMQEDWDRFSKEDFLKFNKEWLAECLRVLKDGGSLWISGSFHNIYQIGNLIQQNHPEIKINNSIVWFKPNAQPNITCRFFTESTEHLIWVSKNRKNKKWKFNYEFTKNHISDPINPLGKQVRNVWSIPLTPRREKWAGQHPTQKPFELLRRIILSCTNENDLILDPFCGTGTTNVVSKFYKRNSIGIEINPNYFEIIKKRISYNKKDEEIIFENLI